MAAAKSTPPPEFARPAIFADAIAKGELEECPTCGGCGWATPKVAARARLALPPPPSERPTEPELEPSPIPRKPR